MAKYTPLYYAKSAYFYKYWQILFCSLMFNPMFLTTNRAFQPKYATFICFKTEEQSCE